MRKLIKSNRSKIIEAFIFFGFGLLLCVAVWQVFIDDKQTGLDYEDSEEARLVAILEQIDGVGEAEVMIGASESGERGVVIVCEGANRLSVVVDIREAASIALGIDPKNVKIYLKNQ